jgi:hypothetical protein
MSDEDTSGRTDFGFRQVPEKEKAPLVRDLPLDRLDRMTETVPLSALPGLAAKILGGEIRGRNVVDVTG